MNALPPEKNKRKKNPKSCFWTLSKKPNLQTTSSGTSKIKAVLKFFFPSSVSSFHLDFYSWHSTNHSSLVFILHQELLMSGLCSRCKAMVLKQRHPDLPTNLTAPWHHGHHSVQNQVQNKKLTLLHCLEPLPWLPEPAKITFSICYLTLILPVLNAECLGMRRTRVLRVLPSFIIRKSSF